MTADQQSPSGTSTGEHAAAPAWRRVVAHASFEVRALGRNGEQLLLTLVLPVLALVVLGRTSLLDLGADRMAVVTPGVLALAAAGASGDDAGQLAALPPPPVIKF